MKAVILAGGVGSRLSEETAVRPKPMVEVGGKPILWHIMKTYAAYGIQDFVICLGYKGYAIKEYFANYVLHMSDVTIDLEHNKVEWHDSRAENWRVTLFDTGEETMTGGRIKRIRPHVDGESFLLTYGDGVVDIHCHILPGPNDGLPDMATSIAIARLTTAAGIKTMIGTPHWIEDEHDTDPAQIRQITADLQVELNSRTIPPTVLLGNEAFIYPDLSDRQ